MAAAVLRCCRRSARRGTLRLHAGRRRRWTVSSFPHGRRVRSSSPTFEENYSREDAALFLRSMLYNPEALLWIVDDPDNAWHFGGTLEVRLVNQSGAVVELGYTTAPHLRGRGLMTAVVALIWVPLRLRGARCESRRTPEHRPAGWRCPPAPPSGDTAEDAEYLRGQWNDLDIFVSTGTPDRSPLPAGNPRCRRPRRRCRRRGGAQPNLTASRWSMPWSGGSCILDRVCGHGPSQDPVTVSGSSA